MNDHTAAGDLAAEVRALTTAVRALEAERDCRAVLALYGHYADYDRVDDWLTLFTEDAVVDMISYVGETPDHPDPADYVAIRLQGHPALRDQVLKRPQSRSTLGQVSQHVMGSNVAGFRLIGEDTATLTTSSSAVSKPADDLRPHVTFESHSTIRWTMRRADGQWRISEMVRRRMGHPDGARLV